MITYPYRLSLTICVLSKGGVESSRVQHKHNDIQGSGTHPILVGGELDEYPDQAFVGSSSESDLHDVSVIHSVPLEKERNSLPFHYETPQGAL